MSAPKPLNTRIRELAIRIEQNDSCPIVEMLLEIQKLRQEILQSAGDGINDIPVEGLHKLVLMMQLVDDLVRDKLNIDRMRRSQM